MASKKTPKGIAGSSYDWNSWLESQAATELCRGRAV